MVVAVSMIIVVVTMVRVIMPMIDLNARMIVVVMWRLADRVIVVIPVLISMPADAYTSRADIDVLG